MADARTQAEKFPKYFVKIGDELVDVYVVLHAFGVTDPCLQHAVKKLLLAGKRTGGKAAIKDIMEARETLNRAVEMHGLYDIYGDPKHSVPVALSPAQPQSFEGRGMYGTRHEDH